MIATKFQRLHPCFRSQATRIDYCEYCPMSGIVEIQRWWSLTRSRFEITPSSARTHDSNEISTATPMFPGSNSRYRLLGLLSYVWVCLKLKMAADNRKQIGNYSWLSTYICLQQNFNGNAYFYRISSSLYVLPDSGSCDICNFLSTSG